MSTVRINAVENLEDKPRGVLDFSNQPGFDFVNSIQIDGEELLDAPVGFECSPAETAAAIASAVSAHGSYIAKAVGETVHLRPRTKWERRWFRFKAWIRRILKR